jgi:hypothetical protein
MRKSMAGEVFQESQFMNIVLGQSTIGHQAGLIS